MTDSIRLKISEYTLIPYAYCLKPFKKIFSIF